MHNNPADNSAPLNQTIQFRCGEKVYRYWLKKKQKLENELGRAIGISEFFRLFTMRQQDFEEVTKDN